MNKYRVTVYVTTDVEAEDVNGAVSQAVGNVRDVIGDSFTERPGSPERPFWVTGIARDENGEFVYKINSESITVAESDESQ